MQTAFDFELVDLEGKRRNLPPGSSVVVFLKDDCPTCHYTIPYLNDLHRLSPVPVLGVSQDDAARSRALAAQFPVLIDRDLAVSRKYELEYVPTIFLIDDGRRILFKDVGFSRRGLNELAERLGIPQLVSNDAAIPEMRAGCAAKNVYPEAGLTSRRFILDPDEAVEWYMERGFTDGLPIVPPSERRVLKMIEAAPLLPDEIVGLVPPDYAAATVEKIAVNAVMAGALPEYMPVIIAGVRAMCREEFNLHGLSATTHPACPLFVVNGPVRHRVGLNSGIGVFGPGFRANATIGRTLNLILRNLGGARPGEITRSTMGHPGRFTYCIAENEEENPWLPFHVGRGFAREQSAITAFPGEAPHSISDHGSRSARSLASMLGLSMAGVWNHKAHLHWPVLLVLCPEHVRTFQQDGWSKRHIQQHIFERVRRPLPELMADDDGGEVFRAVAARVAEGRDTGDLIPKFKSPDDIWIVVAGGTAGKFSAVVPSWSIGPAGSQPVTEVIE